MQRLIAFGEVSGSPKPEVDGFDIFRVANPAAAELIRWAAFIQGCH